MLNCLSLILAYEGAQGMANIHRGKNEGSIWQRPNGIYRAQVTVASGKRISKTFKTKADASKWIRTQNLKLDQGYDFIGSQITLAEYLPQWLDAKQVTLRNTTVHHYRQVIQKHILPAIGNIKLKDLRLARIEQFYADLITAGIGVRTVRVCHNILHQSLEKAIRYSLLIFNPAHGAILPKYKHTEMQVLDEMQVSQFLIAAQDSPYYALYYLAITTGMRQGEIFGLRWDDLQWRTGILHVQRQVQKVPGSNWQFVEPKTHSGRRVIRLGEGTLQALRIQKLRQDQMRQKAGDLWQENGLIFTSSRGTPCNPSNMRIDFNKTLNEASLSHVRFHDLRHTAASLMLNHNIPVIVTSRMLGHSKPSTTLDIYGHLYCEMQDEAAQLMDRLVTPIPVQMPQTNPISPNR